VAQLFDRLKTVLGLVEFPYATPWSGCEVSMSQFEQSLAKFLSGEATSDELRASLESMAPLVGEDMKFVFNSLTNLSAAGHIEPNVHRELLNTALKASKKTDLSDPLAIESSDSSDLDDNKTVFRPRRRSDTPGSVTGDHDQSSLSSAPAHDKAAVQNDSNPKSSRASAWPSAGFSKTPIAAPRVGTVIKNRFVLEQLIASGGMGMVFKARDLIKEEAQERNPYVALKVLNESFKQHPESYLALSREARKTQALAHPNIVNVFDFDRDNETVFMTMELIEGQSLDVAIKALNGKGFPTSQALDYISQMSEALRYAHKKGVLHCDLKPNNVFLASDGVIKILDFGIAQANRSASEGPDEHTRFDAKILGAMTVGYASREIHEGHDPEPSDDIYALACVSYQLLTGKHPYNNKAANTLLEGPEKLSQPEGLNRNQWRALQKALSITRDDRTQSVAEFIDGISSARHQAPDGKLVAAAIAALVVIGLWFYVPDAIKQNQFNRLEVEFLSEDIERIDAAIDALGAMQEEDASSMLSAVESDLKSYFDDTASSITDPEEAEFFLPYLQKVLALYPDSQTLSNSANHLSGLKDMEISNLVREFNSALENNLLLASSGPGNIEELLLEIEQADRQSPMLTDRRLLMGIQQQAQLAVEYGDIDTARSLLNLGLERFPDNAGLVDTQDMVAQMATAVDIEPVAAAGDLEADLVRLDELIEDPQFTPAWDSAVTQVLNKLLQNRVLSAAEFEAKSEEVGALYANKAKLAIAELRFNEASRLIISGRSYAPDFDWAEQERLLNDAREDAMRVAEIEGLKYTFEAQVSAMQLAAARESIEKLTALQPDPADPFLSAAYVDLAEHSATSGDIQDALNIVNDGLAYRPDSTQLLDLRNGLRLRYTRQEIRSYFVEQSGSEETVRQLLVEVSELAPDEYVDFVNQMGIEISETLTRLEHSEAVSWLASIKSLLPELGDSLDRFVEPDSNQRIENLVSTARIYLDEGRIAAGIENYLLAMELDAEHIEVRELLLTISDAVMNEAYELYEDARYVEAMELVDTGIAIDPPNIRTLQQIRQDSQSKLEAPRSTRRLRVPGTF